MLYDPGPVKTALAQKDGADWADVLLETVASLVVVLDPHGRIVRFNRACEAATGLKASGVIGRLLADVLVAPEDRAILQAEIARVLADPVGDPSGEPAAIETSWLRTDGSRLRLRWTHRPLLGTDGTVRLLLGTGQDVTDQRSAEQALRDSEERYRCVVEQASDALFVTALDGRMLDANRRACELVGYEPAELLGLRIRDLMVERPFSAAEMVERLTDGPVLVDARLRRKDASVFPAEVSLGLFQAAGRVCVLGVARDVTDRKRVEEATATLLWHLQSMQRVAHAMERTLDLEAAVRGVLDELLVVFGCDRAFIVHSPPNAAGGPGDTWSIPYVSHVPAFPHGLVVGSPVPVDPSARRILQAARDSETPVLWGPGQPLPNAAFWQGTFSIRSQMLVRMRVRANLAGAQSVLAQAGVRQAGGTAGLASLGESTAYGQAGFWGLGLHQCSRERTFTEAEQRLFQDVARRVGDVLDNLLLHQDLRRSAEHFRMVSEAIPQIVWTADAGGDVDYFNQRWFDLTGADQERPPPGLQEDTPHPDRQDGHPSGPGVEGGPQNTAPPPNAHLSSSANSPYGLGWLAWLHPDDMQPALRAWRAAVEASSAWQLELRLKTRGGAWRWHLGRAVPLLDGQGKVVRWFGTATDIDDQRRAQEAMRENQEKLRQSQKMEAIGRLAGGVAHDFNNLLMAINGYSELLAETLPPSDPRRRHVQEIQRAGERAARLTGQLLAFSRKQVLAPKVLDLNAIVADIENMLRRLIGEDIELRTDLQADLGLIRADPSQIEQVLLNLVVNARDAMPDGGQLHVTTRNVLLLDGDPKTAQPLPAVLPVVVVRDGQPLLEPQAGPRRADPSRAEPWIELSIRDTGKGMDARTRAHLFEPFFTTKEAGKGTGLGLSTVYGILQQSGASITVDSEPGQGAHFRIYLPRVEGGPVGPGPTLDSSLPAALAPSLQGNETMLQGHETILLVEDEPAVRSFVQNILRKLGYRVIEAGSGAEALQRLESEARPGPDPQPTADDLPLDLLLTDVVMAGMSGRELAERLRSQRPDLPVLFMSGYTDDAVVRHGVLQASHAYLAKPVSPMALAHKVRELLDSPATDGAKRPV